MIKMRVLYQLIGSALIFIAHAYITGSLYNVT